MHEIRFMHVVHTKNIYHLFEINAIFDAMEQVWIFDSHVHSIETREKKLFIFEFHWDICAV